MSFNFLISLCPKPVFNPGIGFVYEGFVEESGTLFPKTSDFVK
jgi:hypothetical protein